MKFPFVKQENYFILGVPHQKTLWQCIKWWLGRKNKHCHSFCLNCPWWFRCQEDVALEEATGLEANRRK